MPDPSDCAQIENPSFTFREIMQQPVLWNVTAETVKSFLGRWEDARKLPGLRVLLTGAGTSAYAAASIAAAWPGAVSVPTTDLLLDTERHISRVDLVISLARSGDSPESAAVVARIRALRPPLCQLAIVCNEDGALSRSELDGVILLDPRTNDRSLVMTSAFSNLVLAGLTLGHAEGVEQEVKKLSSRAKTLLPLMDSACRGAAQSIVDRVVVLSSSPMIGWRCEAALKMLEATDGRIPVLAESFLGLRHGPMSFIKSDTFVLCLFSSDPMRRLYELDLVQELRAKKLGYLVGIGGEEEWKDTLHGEIPVVAGDTPDAIRTPFEIIGPQLLAYYVSLRVGLNPDNPSPDGVINRVVRSVKIHSANGKAADQGN
jgi:tagatose-6-phosphate ketose/aldose isomerase